ncbi:putative protein serine/threonine kinase [Cavenderia fasciculata]|uniref:non-specific serine/threonine protein kinase n=1 Tax=Cavenderia fasciculata TaxID=261658 RepID=F4QBZ0_CACFS|nr:putative protein serine/threonine kinase [Cavenderia fasciculata]EGG14728.1 putative protein serine/threonine kinase [Cavenderia fasciculata]|eukprot:XP_004351236.1 putative protein serine/threonine kinase [Cavenderia fasciculata]
MNNNNRYYQNDSKQQQHHHHQPQQQQPQPQHPNINITSYGQQQQQQPHHHQIIHQQQQPHHHHTHIQQHDNNNVISPSLHHLQHNNNNNLTPPTHINNNVNNNISSSTNHTPQQQISYIRHHPSPPPPLQPSPQTLSNHHGGSGHLNQQQQQYPSTLPSLQVLPTLMSHQPNNYSSLSPTSQTMQKVSPISPTTYSPGSRSITLPPLSSPNNTSNGTNHRYLFSSNLPSSSGHFSSTDVYQQQQQQIMEPRSSINLNASPIHFSDHHVKFHLPSINNTSGSYGMVPTSPEPSSLHYISSPYSKSMHLKQSRQQPQQQQQIHVPPPQQQQQQPYSPKPPIPFVNISSYPTPSSTPIQQQMPQSSYQQQQQSPPSQQSQYIEQITSPQQNVYVYNQMNSQPLMDTISIEPLNNNNNKKINTNHNNNHQNINNNNGHQFMNQKKRPNQEQQQQIQQFLYLQQQQQQQIQQQQEITPSFKMYEKTTVPKAILSNYDLKALETSPVNPEFNEKDFPELQGNFKILDKVGQGTFSGVFKSVCLKGEHRGRLVALKRVSPTSSPTRILNEIKTLMKVGEDRYISQLLGIIRHMDQVTLILPYFEHDSFKDYFFKLTPNEFRNYLIAIFSALKHVHYHQICHRDVKPTNFLYNQKLNGFMLIDFGLAQEMPQEILQQPIYKDLKKLKKTKDKNVTTTVASNIQRNNQNNCSPLMLSQQQQQQQQQQNDISKQAPRAGTRGFRAPEVLLKYNKQTTAIDIWSVGVIMMCVLSGRYPFFVSPDDLTSLAEIISIIGTQKIIDLANTLDKEIFVSENIRGQSWTDLAKRLRNESGQTKERMPEEAFQLLELCLEPCPFKRITASEAIRHPFLDPHRHNQIK